MTRKRNTTISPFAKKKKTYNLITLLWSLWEFLGLQNRDHIDINDYKETNKKKKIRDAISWSLIQIFIVIRRKKQTSNTKLKLK